MSMSIQYPDIECEVCEMCLFCPCTLSLLSSYLFLCHTTEVSSTTVHVPKDAKSQRRCPQNTASPTNIVCYSTGNWALRVVIYYSYLYRFTHNIWTPLEVM